MFEKSKRFYAQMDTKSIAIVDKNDDGQLNKIKKYLEKELVKAHKEEKHGDIAKSISKAISVSNQGLSL